MASVATPEQITATPAEFAVKLIEGLWLSRAVWAAIDLGVAEQVGTVPKSVEELAAKTGSDAGALYRLMRALATAGVFEEHPARRFSETPLSRMLREDSPQSLRNSLLCELGNEHLDAWVGISDALRTGECAFDKRFGMPIWAYYQSNPERGQIFERCMSEFNAPIHRAVLDSWQPRGFRRVMDIGGGEGKVVSAILSLEPEATGIIFDVPEVVQMANERLRKEGADDRCTAIAGDFFAGMPGGCDLHVMKWIIHDWDDARALQILRNSRAAIEPGGRLALIESVISENGDGLMGKLMDLNMLAMTGGRERTATEYRELLAAAGYQVTRIVPTQSFVSVIEAEAR